MRIVDIRELSVPISRYANPSVPSGGLTTSIVDEGGTNLDPFRAWKVMMAGEKPRGHGERCEQSVQQWQINH